MKFLISVSLRCVLVLKVNIYKSKIMSSHKTWHNIWRYTIKNPSIFFYLQFPFWSHCYKFYSQKYWIKGNIFHKLQYIFHTCNCYMTGFNFLKHSCHTTTFTMNRVLKGGCTGTPSQFFKRNLCVSKSIRSDLFSKVLPLKTAKFPWQCPCEYYTEFIFALEYKIFIYSYRIKNSQMFRS